MLILSTILSLIMAPKVQEGNANWANFLRLLHICHLCTSPYCSRESMALLEILIAEYLRNYQVLHAKSPVIPKQHYMVHFPRQMLMFGPLRHHWSMRFEGKNGYFSQQRYKNFRNLPLTMAKRHQLHMCFVQAGNEVGRSDDYLYQGDDVKDGESIALSEIHPSLLNEFRFWGVDNSVVYQTSEVKIHGLHFRVDCVLVLDYTENSPMFGILNSIVIKDHTNILCWKELTVTMTPTQSAMRFVPPARE